MNSITFATYNIRHGYDVSFDFSKLAETVARSGADVVGLQEIDVGTRRSLGMDTLAALQNATGMPYAAFTPTMSFDGGLYGTGIISKYPLSDIKDLPLPAPDGIEPRALCACTVSAPDGDIFFVNTHLSFGDASLRAPQFEALAALLPRDGVFVVTGDFNTQDVFEFAPLLQVGAVTANGEERLCMTFRQPPKAIDHIFYPPQSLTLLTRGMVDSDHSDHNLFYATFARPIPTKGDEAI